MNAKPPLRQALAGDVFEQDGVVAQHEAAALAPELDSVQVAGDAIVGGLQARDAVRNTSCPAVEDSQP